MIERFMEGNVPVIAYLEPTLGCNLRCSHCYVGEEGARGAGELTRGELARTLDELAGLGTLVVVVTGGEPLLRPDLFEILGDIRARGFALVLFTNGTLLGPGEARQLHDLAPLGVEISVHGARASTHDAITGSAGSFERSVAAIRLLVGQSVRVKVKCSLMRRNQEEYPDVLALAAELGASCTIDPYLYPRRATGGAREAIVDDRLLSRLLRDDRVVKWRECDDGRAYLRVPGNRLCGAGRNIVRISARGDVHPCVPFPAKAGSVREQSLDRVWRESPLLRKLRGYRNGDLAACMTCSENGRCSRCPAMALNETGDLLGCSPLSRRFAEARGRIALKAGLDRAARRDEPAEVVACA